MILPLTGICQLTPSVPKWVDDIGGSGSSISSYMKIDAQNNILVTGYFSGTVDFDPSPTATKNLTSNGGSIDVFIAKYDTNGALIWVVSFGGSGQDTPNGLDFDSGGNITITGQYFSPTINAGAVTLNNAGGSDTFIIHVNSTGGFLWAKTIGGAGTDFGSKVVNDHENNVIVASQFQSSVNISGTNYSAKGTTDGLITKYDSSGSLIWVISLGATGGDNSTIGILVDGNDNIDITGYLNGTVNFNPLGMANNISGNYATYIAQYTSAGIFSWEKSITGSGPNYATNLALDNQNNIYLEGVFSSTINLGNSATLTPTGSNDIFFAKYTSAGSLQWYKDIGGAGSSVNNYGIAAGVDNNIYLSGYFSGKIDFDPSAGIALVKDHGSRDLFLAKYDLNGNYQWAIGAGSPNCSNTLARFVSVDQNNDVILTGSFCSTVNFDVSNCSTYNVTAQSGVRDFFLAKYTPSALPVTNNVITNPIVTSFCGPGDASIITGSTPTGGGGTYTYQWQSSTDGTTFTDIPGAAAKDYDPPVINVTTYYRRGATSGTCAVFIYSNVITITISQGVSNLSNNVISQSLPNVPICANVIDPLPIGGTIPTGGNGTYAYQWQSSIDNISFNNIIGATLSAYDPPSITITTYYRRGTVTGNCSLPAYSNVIAITVYAPIINIIAPPVVTSFCSTGDAGIITGTAQSGGDGTYNYQWQRSADNINFTDITGANAKDYDPPVNTITTYYRRSLTSGPCTIPVTTPGVPIIITSPPASGVTPISPICSGGSVVLNAFGGTSYQWSPATALSDTNTANPLAAPATTTTYTVTITNGSCISTASVTVNVLSKPMVDAGPDKTILAGDKVQLNGIITGSNFQYSWSPATYLDNPNLLNPTAAPPSTTTYTLTATSAQNCFIISDEVTVNVFAKIVVPNTFTPNDDGINDTWDIAALNTYTNCSVAVYTRNGTQIFKSTGYSKPWDGRYKERPVSFGTYYYTIDLKDGSKPLSGWIAIVK